MPKSAPQLGPNAVAAQAEGLGAHPGLSSRAGQRGLLWLTTPASVAEADGGRNEAHAYVVGRRPPRHRGGLSSAEAQVGSIKVADC